MDHRPADPIANDFPPLRDEEGEVGLRLPMEV
jgi:hypothetical protein